MSELSIFIAVIPVAIVGSYIYNKDKDKEPTKLLAKLILGGVLSCFAVLLVSGILGAFIPLMQVEDITTLDVTQLLIYSFACIALVEESCKFLFLYLFSYNNKEFDDSFDMIVYGIFVGLGFAVFENILYVIIGGIGTGLIRAVTAIPLHACCGLFMGVFLLKAKQAQISNQPNVFGNKILAILIPTIIHGIYDFCAISNTLLIFVGIVLTIFIVSISIINKKKNSSVKMVDGKLYCLKCGNKVDDNFCTNCGERHK